jgi:hypothetical protein
LRQLCERWIYSTCLCFPLDLEEQDKSAFQMDEVFQALIDRTRASLDLDRI